MHGLPIESRLGRSATELDEAIDSRQQGLLGRPDADRGRRRRRSSSRATMRSARRCAWGPGYFPTVLGGLLIAVRPLHPRARAAQRREDRGRLVAARPDRAAAVARPVRLPDRPRRLRPGDDGADLRIGGWPAREFRLVEVLLFSVVLTALCGRRVRLGARPALSADRGLLTRHGPFQQPDLRLQRRVLAAEPALLLHRRAGRHADRRAAGHRAARHHRDAAADHLQRLAGRRADHAGRHLLRRPVRRLDHRHPGQPAGRDLGGRHLHRRLPDGAAGPRRARRSRSRPSARSSPAPSARC